MATVASEKLITAEDFLHVPDPPDGSKLELVRGRIVTMSPPKFRHGLCQVRIAGLLDEFVRKRGFGRVTVESGLVTTRDPDTVRGPDVAFWSVQRLPLDEMPEGYPEVAADLCVEILSPSDSHHDVQEKVFEYLDHGVRMVWVVDPDARSVTIYHSALEVKILRASETLTGDDVLPGFLCPVVSLLS